MNNTDTQFNTIEKLVLEKIETGEVKMRPKAYFISQVVMLLVVSFFVFLLSTFLISYIIFSLSITGHLFLLGFGLKGLESFVLHFPWLILSLDCILLLILDFLVKSFRFAYNKPFAYLFCGSLGLILVGGAILCLTPFNDILLERAEHDGLPVIGNYYNHLRSFPEKEGVFNGTVVSINGNTFILENDNPGRVRNHEVERIMVVAHDNISAIFPMGDKVFIAGDIASGTIQSYGIKRMK